MNVSFGSFVVFAVDDGGGGAGRMMISTMTMMITMITMMMIQKKLCHYIGLKSNKCQLE